MKDRVRLLAIADAGAEMGVGPRMVRRLVHERRIRFVKVGRHVRIPTDAIEEFLERGTVQEVRR